MCDSLQGQLSGGVVCSSVERMPASFQQDLRADKKSDILKKALRKRDIGLYISLK